jgi:hypothetical protein
MPNVAGREFPYTPQGMAAAEQYKQSLGMRGGGMMGFRPVGYAEGDLVEAGDPRLSNQDVRALVDLANDAYQRGNTAGFAGLPEDAGFAGLSNQDVQNNFRVVSETAETLKRLIKSFEGYADPLEEAAKVAVTSLGIREDLVRALIGVIGDEDAQIPTSPIMSPGAKGDYGINPALIDPANQDQMDAYYGGGVPGPSFRPMANQLGVPLEGPTGQTAPDLRNYMDTGSFRGVTYGDPYFEDQLLPGGGEVPRGMRHGGIMSLRRR